MSTLVTLISVAALIEMPRGYVCESRLKEPCIKWGPDPHKMDILEDL